MKHEAPHIKVVGICCFGMSLVGVGPDGAAVTPIYTNADASAVLAHLRESKEDRATVHPSTLHPKHQTLNPQPCTLHPKPHILNPES